MKILKKIREAARLTAVLPATVMGSKPIRCSSLCVVMRRQWLFDWPIRRV